MSSPIDIIIVILLIVFSVLVRYDFIWFNKRSVINRIIKNHLRTIKDDLLNDYTKYTTHSHTIGLTKYLDKQIVIKINNILLRKGFSTSIIETATGYTDIEIK